MVVSNCKVTGVLDKYRHCFEVVELDYACALPLVMIMIYLYFSDLVVFWQKYLLKH